MKFIKENWFRLIIILILLLGVAILAYYFLIYVPKENEARRSDADIERQNKASSDQAEFQKQLNVATAKQNALDECLDSAAKKRDGSMAANEKQNLDGTSYVPITLVTIIDNRYKDDKDLCFKRYP